MPSSRSRRIARRARRPGASPRSMYPPGLDPYALLLPHEPPVSAPGLVPTGVPAAAPAEAPADVAPAAKLSQPRALLCRRTGIGFVSAAALAEVRTLGDDDPAPSLEPEATSAAALLAAAATAVAAEADNSAAASAELSPERAPLRGAEDAAGTAVLLAIPTGEGVAVTRGFSPGPAEDSGGAEAGDATAVPFFPDELMPGWELAAPPALALPRRLFLPCARQGITVKPKKSNKAQGTIRRPGVSSCLDTRQCVACQLCKDV